MLNKLARCSESYLLDNFVKVETQKISFVGLIESAARTDKIAKFFNTLQQISGYESKEKLVTDYPELVKSDTLEMYVGAEIRGSERNMQAKLLEELWTKSSSDVKTSDDNCAVSYKELVFLVDATNLFPKYDHVILQLKRPNMNLTNSLLHLTNQDSGYPRSCLLLHQTENMQFEMLLKLCKEFSLTKTIIPTSFVVNNKRILGQVIENLKYGILFGNFVDKLVVKSCSESVGDIPILISMSLFPASRILFVSDDSPIFRVHSAELNFTITYAGQHSSLSQFKSRLGQEKKFFESAEVSPDKNMNSLPLVDSEESITYES